MEGYQAQPREGSRPPYQRTASRSSTSTRMTSQSANSSISNPSCSPQLPSSHPVHRYHQATCSKPPSSPRPSSRHGSQLSREASAEPSRQTPVSSFLQERLQKERQAESQKLAAASAVPRTHGDLSTSMDVGSACQSSPVKNGGLDVSRPQSTTGVDPAKKKGLGVKEMEHVVSGLHKQNFDLKLELYHRRERQTMLDERVETLESEKTQVEEMNGKLMAEMEKRDKAVEEAVAMIVTLEAKIDELTKERDMVRQVDSQGFYGASAYSQQPLESHATQANILEVPQPGDEAKSLNRVPSFISERSEQTENLRNVYLGTKGSVLSLPRVTEGSPDADNGPVNDLASPALSVLSESSFVSVYGQKGQEKMVPSKVDSPLSLDGASSNNGTHDAKTGSSSKPEGPNRTGRTNSFSRGNNGGQFQPIAGVMEGSPLQRIERLDPAYSHRRETPCPPNSGKNASSSDSGKASRSPGHGTTPEEKREALRKVMTDTPGGVSLHEQALPPTPDTVASSTLRRYKNSNDTLGRRHDGMEGRSLDNFPRLSNSNDKLPEAPSTGAPLESRASPPEPARMPENGNDSLPAGPQPIQRPRSADESTVSHRRGRGWDFDSDESDTDSFESSLDIWLRAGSKPTRHGGRESPDLFGFPTSPTKGSWAMNAMFGPANGHSGGASIEPHSDQMHDLFSAQQALFGPPAPPHRRSSLNAQTGPNPAPSEATPKPASKEKSIKVPGRRRPRHFRRNSDDAQARAGMKTPVQGQFAQAPPQQPQNGEQKRSQYPPITGHQGARHGLSRLWRRSLGGTPASNTPEVPPQNAVEPATASSNNAQPTAVPSWVSSAVEDDRSGATPPPILRNPQQGRGNLSEVETHGPTTPGMDSGEPATPVTAIAKAKGQHPPSPIAQEQNESCPAAGSATGTRRKWLPAFGRSSNLKNKSG